MEGHFIKAAFDLVQQNAIVTIDTYSKFQKSVCIPTFNKWSSQRVEADGLQCWGSNDSGSYIPPHPSLSTSISASVKLWVWEWQWMLKYKSEVSEPDDQLNKVINPLTGKGMLIGLH